MSLKPEKSRSTGAQTVDLPDAVSLTVRSLPALAEGNVVGNCR